MTRCVSIRAVTIGPTSDSPTETWPALIAAVTDLGGKITGAHRTWLDPVGPRQGARSIRRDAPCGHLLGHGVRFGVADDVMAAGEGIETMLSLRCDPAEPCRWWPRSPPTTWRRCCFPPTLRRLYVARDADPAGDAAMASLHHRARLAGIEAARPVALLRRLQRGSPPAGRKEGFGHPCASNSSRRTWCAS